MRLWRTPRTRAILVVVTLGAVAGIVALAAGVYTDALWFAELGHEPVMWTTLAWRVLAPALAGLGAACFLLGNLVLADCRSRGATGQTRPPLATCGDGGALRGRLWPPARAPIAARSASATPSSAATARSSPRTSR